MEQGEQCLCKMLVAREKYMQNITLFLLKTVYYVNCVIVRLTIFSLVKFILAQIVFL